MQNASFHCVSLLTLKNGVASAFLWSPRSKLTLQQPSARDCPTQRCQRKEVPDLDHNSHWSAVNLFSCDRVVLVTISMLRSSQRAQRLQTVLQSGPSGGEARPVETRALAVSAIIWR